ncbi:TetR/AcrR family transcriptional regulator [Nonomuraea sp. NPDC049158]|uniref:TetR/AcrR family transcriptional regulator n=1 Tax=Nonomuraea sp. NPDC049158 TaxID=3155649 RepID=UPI0033C4CA70
MSTRDRRAWGSLNRERIVVAALDLARREGLGAVTIRRVAEEAGASRMALYRHVADKEALIELVADAVAAAVVPPVEADRPWPEQLRVFARELRATLLAYPGFADLLAARHGHGPGALRLFDTVIGIIRSAGLEGAATARWFTVFMDVVVGRVHRESSGDGHSVLLGHAPVDVEGLPHLGAVAPHLGSMTSEDLFESELALVIEGIRAQTS